MANPLIPAGTTPPIPPPVPRFRIADEKGNPTPSFIEWCQLMWAAIQGKGGILDRQAIDENALLRASLSDLTERLAALENLRGRSQTADLQDRITSLEATVIGLSLPPDDNPGQSPTLGFDPSDIYAMIPPPRPADAANFSGILGVINGGTGSSTAAGALTNLGAEAQDATLDALAAYNTNGILTQTAADTFTGRTVTGTAAEITVTNGSGVAGNPTLSLPTALTFTSKTVTGGTFASITLSGTTVLPSSGAIDSSGNLGLGMTPVNKVDITQSQNAASRIKMLNADAGAAASARLLVDNGTANGIYVMFGTGFTTAGINRQNGALLSSGGAGGITLATTANQPIYFAVNSTQVMQHDANRLTCAKPVNLPGYTVATLPAGTIGDNAYVTDALAPTFLAAVVGGGGIVTPVFYNGSAWIGA